MLDFLSLCPTITENVDMTATELLTAVTGNSDDEEEESSIKGATAAPHHRPSYIKPDVSLQSGHLIKATGQTIKPPASDASLQCDHSQKKSGPISPMDSNLTLDKRQSTSTTVKSPDLPSHSEQKNDNIENLTENYSKPVTNKTVLNIGIDSVLVLFDGSVILIFCDSFNIYNYYQQTNVLC